MKELIYGTPEFKAVAKEIREVCGVVPTENFDVKTAARKRIDYLKSFLKTTEDEKHPGDGLITLDESKTPRHGVRRALIEKYENRCQSCLGIYESENLYATRMGPLLDGEPMVNVTLLCGTCKVRFHTVGTIYRDMTSTP